MTELEFFNISSVPWYGNLILSIIVAIVVAYTYTSWLDYAYNAKLNKL